MNAVYPSMTFACLLLLGLCGCGGAEADSDDHDHHMEHFVPAHKPANYSEAIHEIEHRSEHLSEHAGHGHADEASEFQELQDIVGWLPELAADSDLKEADWNKANSASESLTATLATKRQADGTLDLKTLAKAIANELKILESLVSAAGKPEPEIHHDHDHDDDHHHEHDHDEHDEHEHQHDENAGA